MGQIKLFLLVLVVVISLVSSSLFTHPAINARRRQNFKKLYDDSIELKDLQSATLEDKVSVLIKNNPLISVQSAISTLISVGVVAEVLSIIPKDAQSKVRAQSCVVALCSKFITTIQSFDISDFPTRDQYFTKDLLIQAKDEISKLVASQVGLSTAYLGIVLFTQSQAGSVIPFLISELPSMLRFIAIIASLSNNSKFQIPNVEWLFKNAAEGEGSIHATFDIDETCEKVACVAEIAAVCKIAFDLFQVTNRATVRSFVDMLLFSARVLVIQNFLYLRAGYLLRHSDLSALVATLTKQPLVQHVLTLTNTFTWSPLLRPCVAFWKEVADPTTRPAALWRLLGRHNIAVQSGNNIPIVDARPSDVSGERERERDGVSIADERSTRKRGKKGANKLKSGSQRGKNYNTVV